MAFASLITTRRILAFTIGAAVASIATRQFASSLESLRQGSAGIEFLTSQAVQTTIVRMSDRLHALATEPAIQKNLQWNYANSISQTLAAAERAGEVEHLAILNANCESIANSSRQAVGASDHWKPVCPAVGNSTKPEVVWNAKNRVPVIQVAIPLDTRGNVRWMVGQTALAEAWLRQHAKLAAHMREVAPQAAFLKDDGKEAAWTPVPLKVQFGARISKHLVRQLENLSAAAFFISLASLAWICVMLARRTKEESLTSGRNRRTLDQLVANAATDDETKLSFAIGYAAGETNSPGDLTDELVALDRIHRNRFAMTRLDVKEKDLWIEDLQCQLDEAREELTQLRLSVLDHAQQKMVQEGLARKVAASCQALSAAHDDIVHNCQEPLLGLSNLIASWRHGSQTMGLKRFTRLLQESTDQLTRRSDLETGVLAMTSVQEKTFATVFELPARLKQCLQDLRPALKMLARAESVATGRIGATTTTIVDVMNELSTMIGLARPGQRILIRLSQPELKNTRVHEVTGQALGKWLFYRILACAGDSPLYATLYLNVRGRRIKDDNLELAINMVTERTGSEAVMPGEGDAHGVEVGNGAIELADRLAMAVGIDWADKKNTTRTSTGSLSEPASNHLIVRVPLAAPSEWREGASGMGEVGRVAGSALDIATDAPVNFGDGVQDFRAS